MKKATHLLKNLHHKRNWLIATLLLLGGLLFPRLGQAQVVYPTFSVVSVDAGESVTIRAINLPANTDFAFRMGPFGTRGLSGEILGVANSGTGGTQEFTVVIPEELKALPMIAIRMDNFYLGYYAYNWFHNTTTGETGADPTPAPTPTPQTPPDETPAPSYTGFPTFRVTAVVRNETVTIQTTNLPPNRDFVVRMNYMGTQGLNGTVVTTINSGEGGSQSLTFDIPAVYANQPQIAIRIDNPATGLYAFNWFYNYTATVN